MRHAGIPFPSPATTCASGSDGGARARVHARGRDRLRPGGEGGGLDPDSFMPRCRSSSVSLGPPRGNGEVPSGESDLGEDRIVDPRREERASPGAATTHRPEACSTAPTDPMWCGWQFRPSQRCWRCQSLHTNSKDEALALPTEQSAPRAANPAGNRGRDGRRQHRRSARRELMPSRRSPTA